MNGLELAGVPALRRLTLRVLFQFFQFPLTNNDALFRVLSTITSPFFHEFVLEGNVYSAPPKSMGQGYWGKIDKLLKERFANGGEFNLIIRTDRTSYDVVFRRMVKRAFPLLVERGCVKFETSHTLAGLRR